MTFSNVSDEFVGTEGNWTLPGEDGRPLSFSGTYLGFSSSHSNTHSGRAHPRGELVPIGRCSACRWSEFRIFKEDREPRWPYLIHRMGRSNIPEERTRYGVDDFLTAQEVIEVLTTRRDGQVRLSIPAARLLAQAAAIDDGALKDAYNARLVP